MHVTNFIEKHRNLQTETIGRCIKKQRNKCNNLIKKAKATYHRNLIEENATNPRKFWDCMKALFPSKSCHVQTCSNIDSIVKSFSDYFDGAVKILKSIVYPLETFTW